MKFISILVSCFLLSGVITVKAETAIEHNGANSPVVSLSSKLSLQFDQGEPLHVQSDGFIHFQLDIPDLGDEFFSRHHLQLNVPYFSNGYRKNHYIEVSRNGTIPVSIPSEEPVGTPVYLYDGVHKPLKSSAERLITPIVQFLVVYEMLHVIGRYDGIYPYRPVIDFKNGNFLEGIQGYALLDSSLRFSRDASEYLEVYFQLNPDSSGMTVLILFATGAIILNRVPMDSARFDAMAMQKSFINSGLAGKIVDVSDDMIITPEFSEAFFPSKGSVRSFRSRLASQAVRGPVLAYGLSQVGRLPKLSLSAASLLRVRELTPANWLLTKKLMIKAASETRQFNEMVGQSIGGIADRFIEWGLNGAIVAVAGIDGPPGSLSQTFKDEFQQQLGSHGHKQIKELKDQGMKHILKKSHPLHETANQVLIDFSIGGLLMLTIMSAQAEFKIAGSSLLSSRIGKGVGLSFMLRTLGNCVIEPAIACANHYVYDYVAQQVPSMAPFFRRDYLVEIDHGITPQRPDLQGFPPRPDFIHDEL